MNLLNQDWASLAEEAKCGYLSKEALESAAQDRISSMLASLDFFADWEEKCPSSNSTSCVKLQDQPVKVTVYEKTGTGVMAPWSSLELSIDTSKQSVPVTIKVRTSAINNPCSNQSMHVALRNS